VARALNQRAITDTIGHPLDFMPHIMALSRRRDTDFLGKAGGDAPRYFSGLSSQLRRLVLQAEHQGKCDDQTASHLKDAVDQLLVLAEDLP
jgi:hypothetical protein